MIDENDCFNSDQVNVTVNAVPIVYAGKIEKFVKESQFH